MEFDANKPKDWLKLLCFWTVVGVGMATGFLVIGMISKSIF